MGFKTKLNLSENRLFKQIINKASKFVGINEFSVPLEERKLGGDYENAIKSIIYNDIITNFEFISETNTLLIDFNNEEMESSFSNIPTINYVEDGEIYNVLPNLIGNNPYSINNVEFFEHYIGYEYDLTINTLQETENGFIGTFYTPEVILVDAPTLDYKGDNIVLKVNGFSLSDKNLSRIKYNIIDIGGDYTIDYENHFSENIYVLNHDITIDSSIEIGSEINLIKNGFNINFSSEIDSIEIDNDFQKIIKITKNKYIKL